jgi:hypothetical protein
MATNNYLLLKEVTHDGLLRPAGTSIELNAVQAEWALKNRIIAPPVETIRAPVAEPSSFSKPPEGVKS